MEVTNDIQTDSVPRTYILYQSRARVTIASLKTRHKASVEKNIFNAIYYFVARLPFCIRYIVARVLCHSPKSTFLSLS